MTHPALKNAPKSELEALQRIRASFLAGELQGIGTCQYSDFEGKPCAIGSLFTPKQRNWLVRHELNNLPVNGVDMRFKVGVQNIEAMTNMSIGLCALIQRGFDNDYKYFSNLIDAQIELAAEEER